MEEKRPYQFLRRSALAFRILAWVVLVFQVVTGLFVVIAGGEPVFIGGFDIPARAFGIMNFVAAGLYFFIFWLIGSLIRLLLDIRGRLPG